MIARYRITEQDYANAMLLQAKPGWLAWIAQSVLGISLGLILFYAVGSGVSAAAFVVLMLIGIALGALVFWSIRRVLVPAGARRQYRRYAAMQDEFTFELLDDGVRFTSPHGQGTLPWRQMLKWRENDAYLLIYPMPTLVHIVPKAIAAQGFDIAALTERLRTRVGKPV